VHVGCLEAAWKLPGSCLEAAWKLPGSCLESAWKPYRVRAPIAGIATYLKALKPSIKVGASGCFAAVSLLDNRCRIASVEYVAQRWREAYLLPARTSTVSLSLSLSRSTVSLSLSTVPQCVLPCPPTPTPLRRTRAQLMKNTCRRSRSV
jgi:hypothetical protein